MSQLKKLIVEPVDPPPVASESVDFFVSHGWSRSDSEWLGPLALKWVACPSEPNESTLGDVTKMNLKVVAGVLTERDKPLSRNRALLLAFTLLCGCGDHRQALFMRQVPTTPGTPPTPPGLKEWTELARVFKAHGADFSAALCEGGWPNQCGPEQEARNSLVMYAHESNRLPGQPPLVRLMRILVDCAEIDISRLIDAEKLGQLGKRFCSWVIPRRQAQENRRAADWLNKHELGAQDLLSWLIGLGPRALGAIAPAFCSTSQECELAALAGGIQFTIEKWQMTRTHHYQGFWSAGVELSAACLPFLNELERRAIEATQSSTPWLRHARLWFSRCVYESDPKCWSELESERREALLRLGVEELAMLRKVLVRPAAPFGPDADSRGADAAKKRVDVVHVGEVASTEPSSAASGVAVPSSKDAERAAALAFDLVHEPVEHALLMLYRLGGVWRGLKPMVLAWRALAFQAVAKDLRYWTEPDMESPPEPWWLLVAWPINLFHAFIDREQRNDPDLIKLRGDIGTFCLERLSDRWKQAERAEAATSGRVRTNADMVERSPEWRYCCIRALVSLGINPEGKGHRTLKVVAEIDPDEDVREAARQAYEQLRRGAKLPDETSPRRAILSALWWFRQAHLLGLEIQPDPHGAQRTRVKELARTQEPKRDDNPAGHAKK